MFGMTALCAAALLTARQSDETRRGPAVEKAYRDDTHRSLHKAGQIVEIHGQQEYKRLKFTPPIATGGSALDSRRATFIVANSRNPWPTASRTCDQGTLPVNPYPLIVEHQSGTLVVGGLFKGEVPQDTEWQATYCNSAAITFGDAPDGIIDGVRITGAWDAVRLSRNAANLQIVNSWITDARDDAVENDHLQVATIRDTLIDGALQAVSVKPRKGSDTGDASHRLVTLSGVLIRLQDYHYKEGRRFGALLKSDQRAPRVTMTNSVVAVDSAAVASYPHFWATTWAKQARSSNNLILWLSDAPVPLFLASPPPGFRVLRGQAARTQWLQAKTNWIDCHPRLARLASDPRSTPDHCVPDTWGGFTD